MSPDKKVLETYFPCSSNKRSRPSRALSSSMSGVVYYNDPGRPGSLYRNGSLKKAYSVTSYNEEENRLLLVGDDQRAYPRCLSVSTRRPRESSSSIGVRKRRLSSPRRHRKQEDEVVGMSCGSSFCCGFLMLVAEILLFGITALVFFWIMYFHSSVEDGAVRYFTWRSDPEYKAKLGFNLHPVLMIVGFIFLSGQAMLMYRLCRCCRRIWNKLLHALLHLMAMPCIAISFVAVLDSHDLRTIKDKDGNIVNAPIPNFYSLHSWMGLFTMGLFGLQYIAGFFSFLLLLCCESATSSFRASMVPIHSIFGIATFVMAVATACSGLIEKAFFTLSIAYSKWVPYLFDPNFNATTALTNLEETLGPVYTDKMFQEAMVINVLGLSLVLLAVVMTFVVMFPKFRQRPSSLSIVVAHDRYG